MSRNPTTNPTIVTTMMIGTAAVISVTSDGKRLVATPSRMDVIWVQLMSSAATVDTRMPELARPMTILVLARPRKDLSLVLSMYKPINIRCIYIFAQSIYTFLYIILL